MTHRKILAIVLLSALLAGVPPVGVAGELTDSAEGGRYYLVQVGAFRLLSGAEALRAEIDRQHPDGFIVSEMVGGSTVHRVMSGSFVSLAAALTRQRSLAAVGFQSFVRHSAAGHDRVESGRNAEEALRFVVETIETGRRSVESPVVLEVRPEEADEVSAAAD